MGRIGEASEIRLVIEESVVGLFMSATASLLGLYRQWFPSFLIGLVKSPVFDSLFLKDVQGEHN